MNGRFLLDTNLVILIFAQDAARSYFSLADIFQQRFQIPVVVRGPFTYR